MVASHDCVEGFEGRKQVVRLFGGCLSSHPNTTARAKTPQPIGGCAACQTAHFCIGIFH